MVSLKFVVVFAVCFATGIFHCCTLAESFSKTSTRRKRYLSFPNKAAVVLTVSLLKALDTEVTPGPTVRIVTIHELDVSFPLPHDPSPYKLTQTSFGQPPVFLQQQQSRSRHRRDVYRQIEDLFYLQGYEGQSCVKKALCDAQKFPKTVEENLILDLMSVLFSLPPNVTADVDEYTINEKECARIEEHCPFSIFDLAFGWIDQFSTLYNTS